MPSEPRKTPSEGDLLAAEAIIDRLAAALRQAVEAMEEAHAFILSPVKYEAVSAAIATARETLAQVEGEKG